MKFNSFIACTMKRATGIAALVLLGLSPSFGESAKQAVQPEISANSLVKRAVQKELDDNGSGVHMMYRLRKQTPERTETREYLETSAGTVGRVIAINDQPLTPDQQEKEAQRLQHFVSDPGAWRDRQKKQKEDADRVRKMVGALPDAFNYTYDGTEVGPNGEQLARLTFKPNPNFDPPTRELRVYTGMEGRMWIDTAAERLVRLDAHLVSDVDFGWGILGKLNRGGSFEIQQQRIAGDRWETTRTVLNFDGKALMIKSIHIKETETLTDFRRIPDKLTLAEGVDMLQKYNPAQDTVAQELTNKQPRGGSSQQR
jgi:hypothetical protein